VKKMTKIHGSYDGIVMKYEKAKVKMRFPCGCVIFRDGNIAFCTDHWRAERLDWCEEEMLQFQEREKRKEKR
jgi:hypothetical protein